MGTFGLIAAAGACVAGIVWGTRELIILDAQEKEEAVKTANRKKLHGMMSGGDTVVHYTTPRTPSHASRILRPAKRNIRTWGK